MPKSIARVTLLYVPIFVFVLIFVLARLVPRDFKLEIYRFFFSDLLWIAVPYALLAFGFAIARIRTRRWGASAWALVACAIALTTLYARFIEPERIVIRETPIKIGAPIRIALISDLHIGLFHDEKRVQKIVDSLNQLDVDVVVVAGDWTYEPPRPLVHMLAPLSKLKHRALSVPGNHDEEAPGPPLAAELRAALIIHRVEPIEGRVVDIKGVHFVGIGDRWAHKDMVPILRDSTVPLVALAHNPDSLDRLNETPIRTLLAGHTHGGQINLPFVTEWVLGGIAKGGYKRGLYATADKQVFVTSGLGTIGVPLRLFQPPVIDVLICD